MSIDREAIDRWRSQSMTDAEIGHRLGVSAEKLREILGEPIEPQPGEVDDHRPNDARVR